MPPVCACDDLLFFWARLAHGCCAGQAMVSVLASIQRELTGAALAKVVGLICRDLKGGLPLSAALRRHPSLFGKHVICLVEGGELAGMLDRVLPLIMEHAWRCPVCILGAVPVQTFEAAARVRSSRGASRSRRLLP